MLVLGLVQLTPSRMPPGGFVGRERGKLAKIGPFPYSWGIVGPFGAIEREKAPKGEPRAACAGQGLPCVQPLCSAPVFSSRPMAPYGPALQEGAASCPGETGHCVRFAGRLQGQGRRRPAVYRFLGGGRDLEG